MRIIHLSDFHLNNDENSYHVMDPLFEDLKKFHEGEKIDLVIFSGDLIDKGGKSFKDPKDGFLAFQERVIERIRREINLTADKFIICPGNHDTKRELDSKIDEMGLSHYLVDAQLTGEFQKESKGFDKIKRIQPYKEFERSLYNQFPTINVTDYETIHDLNIAEKKVAVAALNTSWRCYDSATDKGNLILGENQIINQINVIENADIKIAVMHHSYDELKDFERLNIKNLLNKHFNLVLTGHVHSEDSLAFMDTFGTTIYSTASSNTVHNSSSDSIFHNGYSVIDFSDNKVTVSFRKYSTRKREYVPDVDLGNDYGVLEYNIPTEGEISEKKRIEEVISEISKVYGENVNEHLLSYKTDSEAPKDINSLFVMPRITEKVTQDKKNDLEFAEKIEKDYGLEDLCLLEKDIILVGQKEMGKTVLLDKILIELSSHYPHYVKVPILIDYNEIKRKTILHLISEYLNVSQKELRSGFLESNSFVILIDNMDFHQHSSILTKLDSFLNDYPNIQLICTTTSSYEDTFQLYDFNCEFIKDSAVLFIKNFRTKEMQQLITKWFGNNKNFQEKKVSPNSIIKRFNKLNLPSTPLAVSMFLWIIEKQETYSPVNNAQMLENFLERLFRKNDVSFVYSSEFSYRNKEYLLTDIAFFMYESNNAEYSIKYEELREHIVDYLKRKMFSFLADEILNEFIENGLLIEVNTASNKFVKFRFSCFFQYYLMKNIQSNPGFKEYILTNDNCIYFINELDYYSGLLMNDEEILRVIVAKMTEKYDQIKYKLLVEPGPSYDTFFEVTKSFTEILTTDKIDEITNEVKHVPDRSEEVNDNILETTDKESKNIMQKETQLSHLKILENYWTLAGTILKNTEEIENPTLKKESLEKIVECSLIFASLVKLYLVKIKNSIENDPSVDDNFFNQYKFLYSFLPNIHQDLLSHIIGTGKLLVAIRDKLDSIINNPQISDFEKFVYTFLYFDLGKEDKYNYIELLMKNKRRIYTTDCIFMNLMTLFYNKNISEAEERKLKGLVAELHVSSLPIKDSRKANTKGKIINDLDKKKLILTAQNSYE